MGVAVAGQDLEGFSRVALLPMIREERNKLVVITPTLVLYNICPHNVTDMRLFSRLTVHIPKAEPFDKKLLALKCDAVLS